jgi:osmotically-inducible protein OsmY
MRRTKSKEVSREGEGSSPPRFASEALSGLMSPHQIELDVQRALLAQPRLHFASLVVRRIIDGVCLQGVLEADADSPDVCSIAQRVSGVRQVLNHLVVAGRRKLPGKG